MKELKGVKTLTGKSLLSSPHSWTGLCQPTVGALSREGSARSLVITPPLLKAPTFGSAPPLKLRGGRGSYDPAEGRFLKAANLPMGLSV